MGLILLTLKLRKHFEEAKIAIADWNAAVSLGKTDINKFSDAVVKNSAQLKAYFIYGRYSIFNWLSSFS